MSAEDKTRIYNKSEAVVFRKTGEKFGGLSNMAPGFPLKVGKTVIRTSEALYQACRFPKAVDVQRMIISQKSPMTAKMKSKPFRSQTRPDWQNVRVSVMRWCLRVKLACNWLKFGDLLLSTGEKSIVEDSRRDRFWGAVEDKEGLLVGENILGRLLMEVREELKFNHSNLEIVNPLEIHDFLLLESNIPIIYAQKDACIEEKKPKKKQLSLFPKDFT